MHQSVGLQLHVCCYNGSARWHEVVPAAMGNDHSPHLVVEFVATLVAFKRGRLSLRQAYATALQLNGLNGM